MSKDKLKPCPFCGGAASIENEGTFASIACDNCGICYEIQISDHFTQEERYNDPAFKWQGDPVYSYAEKGKQRANDVLIEYWNTRAPNKTIDTLVAALEEAESTVGYCLGKISSQEKTKKVVIAQLNHVWLSIQLTLKETKGKQNAD